MKKLVITLMLLLFVSTYSFSQKVYNLDKDNKAKKELSSKTADKAIYNGVTYPIYKSTRGKYYIIMTSKKTGKKYKKYITDVITK